MPSCRFEIFVSSYLDGELSPEERALFETHLSQCDTCRTLMAEWKEVESALRRQALRKALGGKGEVTESVRRELTRSGAFRRARRKSLAERAREHFVARWRPYALLGVLAVALAVGLCFVAPMVGGGSSRILPPPAQPSAAAPQTIVEFFSSVESVLDRLGRESKVQRGSPAAACGQVADAELPAALAYWRSQIALDGTVQDRLTRIETVLVLMAGVPREGGDAEARAIGQAVERAGLLNEVRSLKQKFLESVY